MCALQIATTQNTTCQQVALQHSVPLAGIENLNSGVYCRYLEGETLCGPPSCPVAVHTGDAMSLDPFLLQYNNFTKTQFLGWNTFISTNLIMPGDTVCVG